MKNTTEGRVAGRSFFNGIETIRTSRFSHYLISNPFLEINAMQAIYFELKSIEELFDRYEWGVLYPIYQFYLQCRFIYRKTKGAIKLWRMRQAYLARKHGN